MSIFRPKIKVEVAKAKSGAASKLKFDLRRVENILEAFDIDLHQQTLSDDPETLALTVDSVTPATREVLIRRLQKKAIPKSEWRFKDEEPWLYNTRRGRIYSTLVFERKK